MKKRPSGRFFMVFLAGKAFVQSAESYENNSAWGFTGG